MSSISICVKEITCYVEEISLLCLAKLDCVCKNSHGSLLAYDIRIEFA